MQKTYTIHADFSPSGSGRILQYRLSRYGKTLRTLRPASHLAADPMIVWQLVAEAEKMGATHIKSAWTGDIEKVKTQAR